MIRNNIKKLISINFIIIFILSIINLNQISFASNENAITKGNINVSNIESGVKVTLYKIANIEIDEENNVPKEGINWEVLVKSWVDENFPQYSNPEDFYKKTKSYDGDVNTFYEKIISEIRQEKLNLSPYMEKTSEGTATYPLTEEKLQGNVNFSNVDVGTYIVIIENGYMVYNPSVVNVMPTYKQELGYWVVEDANVVIKASKPSIKKYVTQEGTVKDNYSTADLVSYTIVADVPSYLKNSLSKSYTIRDEMDASLELKTSSIFILGYINADSLAGVEITNYTLETKEVGEKKVHTLIFDYDTIQRYGIIKIMYNAKMTQDQNLVIGSDGNNNYAYLDYANNPYSKTSTQTQKSEKVTVCTYKMDIKSVDKDDNSIGLPGSKFNIEGANGKRKYFVKANNGEYYLAKEDDENAITDIEVDSDGNLIVKGLDDGEYVVKQIKAPDGYYMSTKSYKMKLEDSNLDGNLDEEYSLIFPNSKGFTLPLTGGNGVIIFISLGAVLIIVGAILIVSINKKKKILKNK